MNVRQLKSVSYLLGTAFLLAVSVGFDFWPRFELLGYTLRLSSVLLLCIGAYLLVTQRQWLAGQFMQRKQNAFLVLWLVTVLAILPLGLSVLEGLRVFLGLLVVLMGYIGVQYLHDTVGWEGFVTIRRGLWLAAAINVFVAFAQLVGNGYMGIAPELLGISANYGADVLGFTRPQGLFPEPLYLGFFLHLPIFLLLGRCLAGKASALHYLLLVSMTATLTVTTSRGAYLGMLVGIVVFLILLLRSKPSIVRSLQVATSMVLGVGVAALLLSGSVQGGARSTLSGHALGTDKGSGGVVARSQTFREAQRAFVQNPWFGIGFGSFSLVSETVSEVNPDPIVNNLSLELLAETGVVGATAFLLFLWSILIGLVRRAWSSRDIVGVSLLASLVALSVQYQALSGLVIVHVWVALGLFVAYANSQTSK